MSFACCCFSLGKIGNGPNTVSESTVSNTKLSEFFGSDRVPGRELSELPSAYDLCAKATHRVFAKLTEFAAELSEFSRPKLRKAPDGFKFWGHVMRAILSVRPKCSHGCVSLRETPIKPALILKHATRISTEPTSVRTKWFEHIAI